ncbi:chorismate synthase, partial [Staphylococcus pseudintermedius]|uniref:chorismate synthase n=1 Tax=Staphylococcus pseudintermedius TaxID=283734 RepID=UPI001E2E224E
MRFLTSGESHGPQLTGSIEGLPANMTIDIDQINEEMFKRQGGYGRGCRRQMEKDTVESASGERRGVTLRSPVTTVIKYDDSTHWFNIM